MGIKRTKPVVTRADHICWGCAEEYPAGTSMLTVIHEGPEEFSTTYWCITCRTVLSTWDTAHYDGLYMGEIKERDAKWETINKGLT